jgi:zinc/manganese transport system permease protein
MLTELWHHEFMRNAFIAGTGIAAASGVVGYFVVLRSQVFSTDALSHVAFTSALAALAAGVSARAGLFAGTIAVAIIIGIFAGRGRADDVVIGAVFTWVLGLGVLFLSIYSTSSSATNGNAGTSVLFGSIFGLDRAQAIVAALIGAGLCLAVGCIARPLLLATVDGAIAAARGVPVRALGIGFLALVGVCAAEATQAVGALLLVGLIAAPAGAAQRLTDRPWRGLALAATIAIASMWLGLVVSYRYGSVPPSFAIMAIATVAYALTFAIRRPRARSQTRR